MHVSSPLCQSKTPRHSLLFLCRRDWSMSQETSGSAVVAGVADVGTIEKR